MPPREIDPDRPTPYGYCYACGYSHLFAGDTCATLTVQTWRTFAGPRPLPLDAAAAEFVHEFLTGMGLSWLPADRRPRAAVFAAVLKAFAV